MLRNTESEITKINVKLELELKLHVKWPFLKNVALPFLRNAFYGLNVRSTVPNRRP